MKDTTTTTPQAKGNSMGATDTKMSKETKARLQAQLTIVVKRMEQTTIDTKGPAKDRLCLEYLAIAKLLSNS